MYFETELPTFPTQNSLIKNGPAEFTTFPCVCACFLRLFSHVQENSRRQKTLVCEKFDHLYSILEEKKRELNQKVTDEQEEKVNYIRGLTSKYGDHLEESCKILEMGIQAMDEPEMALFLQVRAATTWGLNLT